MGDSHLRSESDTLKRGGESMNRGGEHSLSHSCWIFTYFKCLFEQKSALSFCTLLLHCFVKAFLVPTLRITCHMCVLVTLQLLFAVIGEV